MSSLIASREGYGTNYERLRLIHEGERSGIKIHGIGERDLGVAGLLKRSYDRGVYMGSDSTRHAAIRGYRSDVLLDASAS